jgi:hypothetical protein
MHYYSHSACAMVYSTPPPSPLTPPPLTPRLQDGMEIGHIKKKWSGLAKEFFTDADNFGVSFSPDLALHVKALILAAVFLIDFMYFEDNAGKNNFNKR